MRINSPFHFYSRHGYQIREARNGAKIRIWVDLGNRWLLVIEDETSIKRAINGLAYFLSLKPQIEPQGPGGVGRRAGCLCGANKGGACEVSGRMLTITDGPSEPHLIEKRFLKVA